MNSRQNRAFTVAELLTMVAIVVVLVLVLLRPAGKPGGRAKIARVKCVNNLKNVALGLRIFATDNPGASLASSNVLTAADFFRGFSNELSSPHILICPADQRQPASNWVEFSNPNLSYFGNRSGRTEMPTAFLAGDRNLTVNGKLLPSDSILTLSTNTVVGWTHEMHVNQGHIAMGDGSVQLFSSARLPVGVRDAVVPSTLLIP